MTEKDLLLYLLEYTYEKEGSYPPLPVALGGLTPVQASWKPAQERHSIWQIVRHMAHWMEAVLQALEDQPQVYEDLQRSDWRAASGDERGWQADVGRPYSAPRRFKDRLLSVTDEDISKMNEPDQGESRDPQGLRVLRT